MGFWICSCQCSPVICSESCTAAAAGRWALESGLKKEQWEVLSSCSSGRRKEFYMVSEMCCLVLVYLEKAAEYNSYCFLMTPCREPRPGSLGTRGLKTPSVFQSQKYKSLTDASVGGLSTTSNPPVAQLPLRYRYTLQLCWQYKYLMDCDIFCYLVTVVAKYRGRALLFIVKFPELAF